MTEILQDQLEPRSSTPATALDLILERLTPGAPPQASVDAILEIAGEKVQLARRPVSAESLTRSQRRVADFLVANPEDCAFLPAAAIGSRCGVSESTVVRFAFICGLSGYPQMQRIIQLLLRDRLSISERVEQVVSGPESERHILQRVVGADIKSLEQTLEAISFEEFDKAISLLDGAERIHVLGLRTSAALASMLATTLRYIGRDATTVDLGIGDFWERLAYLKAGDVFVAISFRSYTTWTQDIIRHVHQMGIPVILITDSVYAPPTAFAAARLVVHRGKGTIVESSTAPMSLVNALAVGVAVADEERSLASLRTLEELWQDKGLHQHKPKRPEGGRSD